MRNTQVVGAIDASDATVEIFELPPLCVIPPADQQMSSAEARRKSISLDCDTIYFSDVLGSFRDCASGCGSSFYFEDEEEKVRPLPLHPNAAFPHMKAGKHLVITIQPSSDAYKETHVV